MSELALIGVRRKHAAVHIRLCGDGGEKRSGLRPDIPREGGESLWDYAYFTGVSIDRLAENNRHITCIAALKDGEEVHVP